MYNTLHFHQLPYVNNIYNWPVLLSLEEYFILCEGPGLYISE